MTDERYRDLLVGTGNAGKVREIRLALGDLPVRLRSLEEFPQIWTPPEPGASYEENATAKAKSYSLQTGLCVLADDSGLEVDALGGAPGILSARYAGEKASDEARIRLLLSELSKYPDWERRARFVCVVVIADPEVANVAVGKCEGRIAAGPSGSNGFGFDPVFVPQGYDCTFAQLPSEAKNKVSHRARALAATRQFLSGWLDPT